MQDQDSKNPDLKHRFDDYPSNNIDCAADQITTILSFLYGALEDAQTLPNASNITVERLISDKTALIERVNDALHIIDSLNRDVKAIARAM